MSRSFDRIVIGAGINGLCTAWALVKRGHDSVAILESHVVGGLHGSSHGHSRITRSAYSDSLFVQLMQKAHNHYWPNLENDLGMDLKTPTQGLIWGPTDGIFSRYAMALISTGTAVEPLALDTARKRFPQFRFNDSDSVLEDHTAGIISAQQTIIGLKTYLLEMGVEILEGCEVQSVDPSKTDIRLFTNRGAFMGQRVVACGGPWMSRLFPILNSRLRVSLQKVFYWGLNDQAFEKPGKFPVWVALGQNRFDGWYGLPAFGRPGLKIAQHRLDGDESADEDAWLDRGDINLIKSTLEGLFVVDLGELSGWESCKYTVTDTEDFILCQHPDDERIILGAGFSGHGFKFGPLTGAALASLCDTGQFEQPLMNDYKIRFAL